MSLSRRNFLGGAAAIAGAVALPPLVEHQISATEIKTVMLGGEGRMPFDARAAAYNALDSWLQENPVFFVNDVFYQGIACREVQFLPEDETVRIRRVALPEIYCEVEDGSS